MNYDIPMTTGTCQYMCPLEEIKMREREGRIHPLESSHEIRNESFRNRKQQTADINKMVKEYSRPAAGCQVPGPGSLRPVPVLFETVEYIFNKIIPRTDHHWSVIYDFSFDRLRAVRQDMVIQRIEGQDAIVLLEYCVRFHIYAGYRLAKESISTFDPVINSQHAQECLKRLLVLYERVKGPHEHQEEFESVYLLYNLGDLNALRHCLSLNKDLRDCRLLKMAYSISVYHILGNYVRTIRQAHKLPCSICLCAFHRHLKHIQQNAFRTMASGFSSKNSKVPCGKLQKLLSVNSETEIEKMADSCGLKVTDGFLCCLKSSFNSNTEFPTKHWTFLDEKLSRQNISSLLLGQTHKQTDSELTGLERNMEKLSVQR